MDDWLAADRGASEKAQAALAERFSIRGFHNLVLGVGSVPLEVLEREVDAWIRSR